MTSCLMVDHSSASGLGRYAYSLAAELGILGAPVHVARFCSGGTVEPFPGQAVIKTPVFLPAFGRSINWFFRWPRLLPRDCELYHATNQLYLAHALRAARGLKVLTVHDVFIDEMDPISRWALRRSLRRLRDFDRFIAVSRYAKWEAVRSLGLPPDKVDVVYEGVNCQVFRPGSRRQARLRLGLPIDAKIVLHVGCDVPRKNVAAAVRALACLDDRRILFVRVGGAAPRTRRLLAASAFGFRTHVVEGGMPDQDLAEYYRAADLFLFPSLREGFGLPVLEAMSCGTPVVCGSGSALDEVAADASLRVDGRDEKGLGEAVRTVLDDEATAQRLTRAGVRRASSFTWRRCAVETLQAYKKAGWDHGIDLAGVHGRTY